MGQLLREIENDTLIDALKGISEEEREAFFAAMSTRAADGVRDEIEARGRVRKADVQAAQAGDDRGRQAARRRRDDRARRRRRRICLACR